MAMLKYTRLCLDEKLRNYLPIYLNSYSSNYSQPDTSYPKGIYVHHLILTLEGEGKAEIDGKTVTLKENSIFFYRADVPVCYYGTVHHFTTCFLTFQGSASLQLLDFYSFPNFVLFENEKLAKQLYDICLAADNGTREELLSSRVYTLVNDIGLFINADTLPRSFEKAVSYIRNNYYKDISITDIAKSAGISESLLYKNFKKFLNASPNGFITQLRIDWAKHYLETSDNMTISDISTAVGFSCPSYFIETFKKQENITPLQYKKYMNKIK